MSEQTIQNVLYSDPVPYLEICLSKYSGHYYKRFYQIKTIKFKRNMERK